MWFFVCYCYRDLCSVQGVQERDRAGVQTDPEGPGNQCGPHHYWGLHGECTNSTV